MYCYGMERDIYELTLSLRSLLANCSSLHRLRISLIPTLTSRIYFNSSSNFSISLNHESLLLLLPSSAGEKDLMGNVLLSNPLYARGESSIRMTLRNFLPRRDKSLRFEPSAVGVQESL